MALAANHGHMTVFQLDRLAVQTPLKHILAECALEHLRVGRNPLAAVTTEPIAFLYRYSQTFGR